MVDEVEPGTESDLRRRAAWLLGMLAVVAVLFLIVLTTVIHSGGGHSGAGTGPGPLDGIVTTTPGASPSTGDKVQHTQARSSPPASNTSSAPSSPAAGQHSCPGTAACILDGDIGNGVAAINAYRTQHGMQPVSGAVSPVAQQCALDNGNNCTGGWAETELAAPDGTAAVQKILPFAHLLDPATKSVDVGWAYDPHAHLYYFAIIRNG